MNTTELYNALSEDGEIGIRARQVLMQTHWFSINAEFDPKSGVALPQPLTRFLRRIASNAQSPNDSSQLRDRLWRIADHCRDALEHLFHAINENPQREHAQLPLRSVRELDASSFIKLSVRPGRNIREKLAGKPYLEAVRRFQSVNLPENRLLKAFVTRLCDLLTVRRDGIGEDDPLIAQIQDWLRTEDAMCISRWENIPPNNALLSHMDYRRVWDSWRWLQTLDDDIARDMATLEPRQRIMNFWNKAANLVDCDDVLRGEIPILFDYDKFHITPGCTDSIFISQQGKVFACSVDKGFPLSHRNGRQEKASPPILQLPVCVDITGIKPIFATGDKAEKYPTNLVWQQWRYDNEQIAIDLFEATSSLKSQMAITVTTADLFFGSEFGGLILDQAANSFASKLHQIFRHKTLYWLVPDFLSEFDLEIVRRNLNATFEDAEPIPRSVAILFQAEIDLRKVKNGWSILVIDCVAGKLCGTKFVAKYSAELKQVAPETFGISWERYPAVILREEEYRKPALAAIDPTTLSCAEQECDEKILRVTREDILRHKELNVCNAVVQIGCSPVVGGIRLTRLQKKAKNIPLWYDHLPDLAMRAPINGILRNFPLVKDKTILPLRKKVIPLEITKKFSLSAGKKDYGFPLVQGDGDSGIRYMAHLQSNHFPLRHDTVFTLQMTYEYGADIPYRLVFVSDNDVDGQPIKISVQWRPYSAAEDFVNAYNCPEFPVPSSFDEVIKQVQEYTFRCFEQSWWENFENQYDAMVDFQRDSDIDIEEIHFKQYKEGNQFAFGYLDDGRDVYCHKKAFSSEDDFNSWCSGKPMYACIEEREKGLAASLVSSQSKDEILKEKVKDLQKQIAKSKRSLHFALYNVLGTLQNWNCAERGSKAVLKNIKQTMQYIVARNTSSPLPGQVKKEMFLMLSFAHKYAPSELGDYLLEALESPQWKEYITEVGYAIGDCSQSWQKRIWDIVLSHWTAKGIIEASSVRIMNIALLRNPHLMDEFSFSQADSYIEKIVSRLEHDLKEIDLPAIQRYSNIPKAAENKKTKETYVLWKESLKITALLELSLLMLLLRKSEDPSINQLLYPTSPRTIKFLKLLDRLDPINFNKFSRIKISVKKPKSASSISDLLFALKYYLSGSTDDVGIQVLEVKNESEDQ